MCVVCMAANTGINDLTWIYIQLDHPFIFISAVFNIFDKPLCKHNLLYRDWLHLTLPESGCSFLSCVELHICYWYLWVKRGAFVTAVFGGCVKIKIDICVAHICLYIYLLSFVLSQAVTLKPSFCGLHKIGKGFFGILVCLCVCVCVSVLNSAVRA